MAAFTVEAVTAGMELGVFDELSEQPLAAETLADRIDADSEGVEILLRALVPLGYLRRDGDTYRLTNATRRSFPTKNAPAFGTFLKTQAREGLTPSRPSARRRMTA